MHDLADCQQSSLSVMPLGVKMQSVDGMERAFKAEWINGQVGLAVWSSITIDQSCSHQNTVEMKSPFKPPTLSECIFYTVGNNNHSTNKRVCLLDPIYF